MSRTIRTLAALFLAGVLALLLAGCATPTSHDTSVTPNRSRAASTTNASAVPQPLTIVETAYRWIPPRTRYPFNAAVDFAYVLKNPNSGFGATSTVLRITMRDSVGKAFSTDDFPVWAVRPGETMVGGSQSFSDHKPASVQFQLLTPAGSWVEAGRWLPADFKPLQVVGLQLHWIKGKPAPDLVGYPPGYAYFTGVVVNPNSTGIKESVIEVLHRDAGGKLLGHYDLANTDGRIAAGGHVAFRIDTPDKLPAGDIYEAFAQPWYETTGELPIRNVTKPHVGP